MIDVLEAGPGADRGALVHGARGASPLTEILDRLADPEEGLGFDRATLQQLMDSGQIRWSGPAGRPAVERGDPLPRDLPHRGRRRRGGRARASWSAQLDTVMTELDVASAQERFNLTPYEVLIVASLIEEETKVDAERAQVARVIYNRLSQGIPLGHRRHVALRGRAGRARPRGHRLRERLAVQHPPDRRAPAHADRVARAGPASRPRSTPPTGRGSTTCSRTPRATTSSPTATASSSPPRTGAARPGWAAGSRDHRAHPGGRRDRHTHPALAVARHLQRRLRRRGARLGVPRLRRARGSGRPRPRRHAGARASRACR